MNNNEARTLWISVGAALFAVFLLYSYTQEKSAELTKKFGAKHLVVVAAKDIGEMQTIDETMLQTVEKPENFIEPQAITDPEQAVGLVSLAPIKKDEQILQTKITNPGVTTGLALQVSPSKRAVAIPVSENNSVAKLVKPGDRIDILAAIDVGKGMTQHREVKTIMQDVSILSTGQVLANELPIAYEKKGKEEWINSMRNDTSFTTITVEASPEETQDLIFLLSTSPGSIFMTLRHPSDHSRRRMPEASTLETLLGKASADMLNAAPPPPPRAPAAAPPPAKPVKQKPKTPWQTL